MPKHKTREFKIASTVYATEISQETLSISFDLMASEKKSVDLALSEFYEAIEKTNGEKNCT